jgi:hypothetical protein
MTPEERELLGKIAVQVEENNTILRSMRRSQRFATLSKVFYWVLIIVLSFGAYVAIQPYLNMLGGLNKKIGGSIDQVGQMQDLLKEL